MVLHALTTPPAENWPDGQVADDANPPAHDDPATQFEHDAPLT